METLKGRERILQEVVYDLMGDNEFYKNKIKKLRAKIRLFKKELK